MRNLFPTICVDNFYEDPDKIREFALAQKYFSAEDGRWPGKRTSELIELNEGFFHHCCSKLMSVFFDFEYCEFEWEISSSFQLIEKYSDDVYSQKNRGWVHCDTDSIFTAIVYLTPNIDPKTGISIFKMNDELKSSFSNNGKFYNDTKHNFFKHGCVENYERILTEHNSYFTKTIEFSNIYNRIVGFDNLTFHGVNSYHSDVPRLTQTFFVKRLDGNSEAPLLRSARYGL